ncbi:MAG: peptide-methionine (R)-S-oxide reductase MsrB [Planctomycetota bacterium]
MPNSQPTRFIGGLFVAASLLASASASGCDSSRPAATQPGALAPAAHPAQPARPETTAMTQTPALPASDAEWRQKLTPKQYHVLRQHGTEAAGTGEYLHTNADGHYCCAGCGQPLYDSGTKFDHDAWPAFTDAIAGAVATTRVYGDTYEVHCARCGGHLGHIFQDGPGDAGTRH